MLDIYNYIPEKKTISGGYIVLHLFCIYSVRYM